MKKTYSIKEPLSFFDKILLFELRPKGLPMSIFKSKGEAKILAVFYLLMVSAIVLFAGSYYESFSQFFSSSFGIDGAKLFRILDSLSGFSLFLIEGLLVLRFKRHVDPKELTELFKDIEAKEEVQRREKIIKFRSVALTIIIIVDIYILLLALKIL